MTGKLCCGTAEAKGVWIFFELIGPTSKSLGTCKLVQKQIQELHFQKTEASFFVKAPRTLSLDPSIVNSKSFPSDNPSWMVIVFPWKDCEKKKLIEFDPFLFEKEE